MPYQDLWRHGDVIEPGDRTCADRYATISDFINEHMTYPWTILDLGAAEGYFTTRLAQDFPECVVVGISPDEGFVETLEANTPGNAIGLTRQFDATRLRGLRQSEHFDLVLCLNVLHHFGVGWQKVGEIVHGLGDHVLIETPAAADTGACHSEVVPVIASWVTAASHHLTQHPSHTSEHPRLMCVIDNQQPIRQYAIGATTIVIDAAGKWGMQQDSAPRPWIPAINLITFLDWQGVYPSQAQLLDRFDAIPFPPSHGDIRPWNVLVQGPQRLVLIDAGDPSCEDVSDDEGRAWVREAIRTGNATHER